MSASDQDVQDAIDFEEAAQDRLNEERGGGLDDAADEAAYAAFRAGKHERRAARKVARDAAAARDNNGGGGGGGGDDGGGGGDGDAPMGADDDGVDAGPLPEWAAPGVTYEQYTARKALFERDKFYFQPGNQVGWVRAAGGVELFSDTHAKRAFDAVYSFEVGDGMLVTRQQHRGRESFMDMWHLDPRRRVITSYGWNPEPDNPRHLHTPMRWPWEGKGLVEDRRAYDIHVDAFLQLVDEVTGGFGRNGVELAYHIRYWAHMIQKPLERPDVALVLVGDKGVGKDSYGEFIGVHLCGDKLFCNFDDAAVYFEKHSVLHDQRIFVKLEDVEKSCMTRNRAVMKARITTPTLSMNPKGGTLYQSPTWSRIMITANEANAVSLNGDGMRDRRFFLTHAKARRPDWKEYFKHMRATLFSDEGGRAVVEYLMGVDITDFHPRDYPVTEVADVQYEEDRTPEEVFLLDEWDGDELSSRELYELYDAWARREHHDVATIRVFGTAVTQLKAARKLTMRIGNKKMKFISRSAATALGAWATADNGAVLGVCGASASKRSTAARNGDMDEAM